MSRGTTLVTAFAPLCQPERPQSPLADRNGSRRWSSFTLRDWRSATLDRGILPAWWGAAKVPSGIRSLVRQRSSTRSLHRIPHM